MAQDYSNLTGGLRTQTQIPLDVKTYSPNEATLANLGTSDNLAFTYTQGLTVYCIEEQSSWIWREVTEDDTEGLLTVDYTYPSETPIVFGIDYADRIFNFFPILLNGTNGTNGTNGVSSYTYIAYADDASGTGFTNIFNSSKDYIAVKTTTSSIASPIAGDFTGLWKNYKGTNGVAGPSADNLQKTITYPGDFSGINYTVSNTDNNYTIFINNSATNVNIVIPAGLSSNIEIGFIRLGSADVTFTASGTTINSPNGMLKHRLQYSNSYIVQRGTSNIIQLCGDLKS